MSKSLIVNADDRRWYEEAVAEAFHAIQDVGAVVAVRVGITETLRGDEATDSVRSLFSVAPVVPKRVHKPKIRFQRLCLSALPEL